MNITTKTPLIKKKIENKIDLVLSINNIKKLTTQQIVKPMIDKFCKGFNILCK